MGLSKGSTRVGNESHQQQANDLAEKLMEVWSRPSPNEPRKQHLVPKSYLKRWAGSDKKLAWIDRSTGELEFRSAKRATRKNDFYTVIDLEGKESFSIEKMLAWVEDRAAPAIDAVLAEPEAVDDVETRERIAVFLGFQTVRGTDFRETHHLVTDWQIKFDALNGVSPDDPDSVAAKLRERGIDPTPESIKEYVETLRKIDEYWFEPHKNQDVQFMMEMATYFGSFLMNAMQWSVYKYPSPVVVTSDTPVVHVRSTSFMTGYATPVMRLFPLDPFHLMSMQMNRPPLAPAVATPRAIGNHIATFAQEHVFAHRDYPEIPRLSNHVRRTPRVETKIIETDDLLVITRNPASLPPDLRSLYFTDQQSPMRRQYRHELESPYDPQFDGPLFSADPVSERDSGVSPK